MLLHITLKHIIILFYSSSSKANHSTSFQPNITKHEECMLNNSANSVRGRRTQHERKNIASAAIPEEKLGESQNDLSEHSSDEN